MASDYVVHAYSNIGCSSAFLVLTPGGPVPDSHGLSSPLAQDNWGPGSAFSIWQHRDHYVLQRHRQFFGQQSRTPIAQGDRPYLSRRHPSDVVNYTVILGLLAQVYCMWLYLDALATGSSLHPYPSLLVFCNVAWTDCVTWDSNLANWRLQSVCWTTQRLPPALYI